MNFISDALNLYVENHTDEESELLKKIYRDTQADVIMPRMISGHFQGKLLSMFVAMIRPEFILELGTFTGYSAICMAENLQENGKIFTIDINEELETRVRKYFLDSGFNSKINYIIGDALNIISSFNFEFDLVFIDADKKNNLNYYNLVFEKVKKGGFIITDNVLWSGKVVEQNIKKDKDLEAILAFNDFVKADKRVKNILLPIRDGLLVAQKI